MVTDHWSVSWSVTFSDSHTTLLLLAPLVCVCEGGPKISGEIWKMLKLLKIHYWPNQYDPHETSVSIVIIVMNLSCTGLLTQLADSPILILEILHALSSSEYWHIVSHNSPMMVMPSPGSIIIIGHNGSILKMVSADDDKIILLKYL